MLTQYSNKAKQFHEMSAVHYGEMKAMLDGRKRITDEIAMRYASPEYHWNIRNLLEMKKFNSVKELFAEYSRLKTEVHADGKSALEIGFFYSLKSKVDNTSNKPFIFESDEDFEYLYHNGIDNCNKTKEMENYFTLKNS